MTASTLHLPSLRRSLAALRLAIKAPRLIARRIRPQAAAAGFYNSPLVQQEADRIINERPLLAQLADFPHWEVESKRAYLGWMGDYFAVLQTFVARLRLSDDPLARETLRCLHAKLLAGQVDWDGYFFGYAKLQSMLGELVDGEEELARLSGSDPAAAAVARRAMADVVGELSVARRGAP